MALVPVLIKKWINSYPCLRPSWVDFEQGSAVVSVELNSALATETSGRASVVSNILATKSLTSGPGQGLANAYGLTELTQLASIDYSSFILRQLILELARIASTEATALAQTNQNVGLEKFSTLHNQSHISATAAISLEDVFSISITGGAENLFSIDVARALATTFQANAAALPNLGVTVYHLTNQSAIAAAFASAYNMLMNHELAITRRSIVALSLALAISSGINASAKIEIDLTTDMLAAFGIEEAASISAETNIALAQSIGITLLAQALLEANLSLSCVQSITTETSVISTIVKLPSGRYAKIAIDVRTKGVTVD